MSNIASSSESYFLYRPGVEVPRSVTRVRVHYSVKILPNDLFAGCYELKDLVLPSGLLVIGDRALYYCRSLERIDLPIALVQIGARAFSACASLKAVSLLDRIRTIGYAAFSDCSSLEDINLPASLTEINERAFLRCGLLRKVKLCGGILTIKEGAFDGCRSMGHLKTLMRGLVVTSTGRDCSFLFVMDGLMGPPKNCAQVAIFSECFNSMRAAEISEAEIDVTEILGLRLGWDDKRKLLGEFLAPHELRHKVEVTTFLELGLWKAKLDESDVLESRSRQDLRVKCGADIIVRNVVPFI